MEFFVYCRDRPGAEELHRELSERHWSFMDGYADGMIARGPTYTDDEETITGSLHIVDLPGVAAARVFAFEEPNYRAGVYGEVLIRRWRNTLGRTMWDFAGNDLPRFLIIGHGRAGADGHEPEVEAGSLIACGPLLSDDGSAWLGTAVLVEMPDRAAAEAVLAGGPYERVEVHTWFFGGRPGS